jgi:hypothetical protein
MDFVTLNIMYNDINFNSILDYMYDYMIIGAGPCGITISYLLSRIGKKVLLIDREKSIGGCHRVRRTSDGLFTEHGPRIYMDANINFINVLKLMKIDFASYFEPYQYQFPVGLKEASKILTLNEMLIMSTMFIMPSSYLKSKSVGEFVENFSVKSKAYLDKVCRLTDGAGVDRYTLYEFMHLANQNLFYKTFVPSKPTDTGLFEVIYQKLQNQGVVIKLNKSIENMSDIKDIAKKVVFATPLCNFTKIVKDKQLANYDHKVHYETYIPVTFHWSKQIQIPNIWGNGKGPWGIMWIPFNYEGGTILSTAVSLLNINGFNGKTAHGSNKSELIAEIYQQVNSYLKFNKKPTKIVLSPGVYKEKGKWTTIDHSYVRTKYTKPVPFHYTKNIFTVGTHNEKSNYALTSIESAVSNGIEFCNKYEPSTKSFITQQILVKTITNLIVVISIIAIIVTTVFYVNNSKFDWFLSFDRLLSFFTIK